MQWRKFLSFFLSFFLCAITLQAQISPEKPTFNNGTNAPESDFPSEFSCEGMIIHPNDDDFGTDPLNIGKVIIWTGQNPKDYHTLYQKNDRIVEIEVKFPPSQSETTVYFRVIDFDDQSPYAINSTLPNTNYEAIGTNGVGLHTSSMASGIGEASLARPVDDSQGFKIATCYLKTTDRYSGDNYKVQASLDPSFSPGSIVETSNLVAWKRAYVDVRYMWTKGSYVTLENAASEKFVIVKNTDDFNVGDIIEIFYYGNRPSDIRQITSKSDAFLRFENDEPIEPAPEYAGVKKVSTKGSLENTTVRNGLDFVDRLKDGFGYNGNGDDSSFDEGVGFSQSGGGFVEFIYAYKGYVPNFRGFQHSDLEVFFSISDLSKYWHDGDHTGSAMMDSRYTLIFGRDLRNNGTITVGISERNLNISFAGTEKEVVQGFDPLPIQNNDEIDNTVVHEIGHQFNLPEAGNVNNHVDRTNIGINSNDAQNTCIMEYTDDHSMSKSAEFCSHHNNGFPNLVDHSCIEDIRKHTWPN